MWTLLKLAGSSKVIQAAILALVVILSLSSVTLYIQKEARDNLRLELELKQLQQEKEIVRSLDEDIQDAVDNSGDPTSSLEWLQRREPYYRAK